MNDGSSGPETPPALNHARQSAQLRQVLQEVYDAMTESHGEEHPWIPGATAKPLLPRIKQALGIQ